MSTVNADEQLEILDNGSHLGWTNVSEGKWSYTHSGLPIGPHSLTATYKGKVAAAWRVEVIEPSIEHTEGFEDLQFGYYLSLPRPYFTATLVQGGGDRAVMLTQPVGSYTLLNNMTLKASLVVSDARDTYRSVLIRIDFNTVYSELYFGCFVAHDYSSTRTSRISIFGQNRYEIEYRDLAGWASRRDEIIHFGKENARNIVAMEMHVSIPYPNTGQEAIWIDNIRMIT